MSRLGSLRIILCPPGGEDGTWFAQGLEFDYAAQGGTLEDVLGRFEGGLALTVAEQMRAYGKCFLRPAMIQDWAPLYAADVTLCGTHVIDFTDFPFGLLSYFGGPMVKQEWERCFLQGRE